MQTVFDKSTIKIHSNLNLTGSELSTYVINMPNNDRLSSFRCIERRTILLQ